MTRRAQPSYFQWSRVVVVMHLHGLVRACFARLRCEFAFPLINASVGTRIVFLSIIGKGMQFPPISLVGIMARLAVALPNSGRRLATFRA